jgi:hypothetical protein
VSTYPAAAAALLALCRASGPFDEANSAADDFTVLDAGYDLALLIRGIYTDEADEIDDYGAHDARQERHVIEAQVWKSTGTGDGGMGAIDAELIAATEALKDYVRPYERLNGTARRARIVRTTRPESNGTRSHRVQIITFHVDCEFDYEPIEVGG